MAEEDISGAGLGRCVAQGDLSTNLRVPRQSGRRRILRNLNRVFDRDPGRELALRPNGPGGLRWSIADSPALTPRTLLIQRPGEVDLPVLLEGRRIADVRDLLLAEGVALDFASNNPALLDLDGLALVPGEGEQFRSNGDHIHSRASLLWAWAEPVGRWLDQARLDIAEMLRMLVVRQSGGLWADLWARHFGLLRRPSETDAKLNLRTEWEWRRPRNNPKAMELNILVLHDQVVVVREPWRQMMMVSKSVISGDDHLPNEEEYAYHRIQLLSRGFPDWTALTEEAEADRPAGTLLMPPLNLPAPWELDTTDNRGLDFGGSTVGNWQIKSFDGHVISVNWSLSNSFRLKSPDLFGSELGVYEAGPLGDAGDFSNRITIGKGEIVASDQWPLGHPQEHLAGRMLQQRGAPMVASGNREVSNYEWSLDWVPVPEWLQDDRGYGPPVAFVFPAQTAVAPEQGYGFLAERNGGEEEGGVTGDTFLALPSAYDSGWAGSWDSRPWVSGFPKPVLYYAASDAWLEATRGAVASRLDASFTTTLRFQAVRGGQATATAGLTTQIRMAGSTGAQAGAVLSQVGPASLVASPGAVASRLSAALSTQIPLAGVLAAQAAVPQRSLTTAIRLAANVSARSAIVAAGFTDTELTAAAQASSLAGAGTLTTALNLAASRGAIAAAGPANLTVVKQFQAARGGQATATAGLSTAIRMAGSGAATAAHSASLLAAARLAASRSAVASRLTANLRVGVRLNASRSATATATAGLTTASGATAWPATNRTWLMDPDDASKRTMNNNKVVTLADVAGSALYSFTQAVNAKRPQIATVKGRGVLDFEASAADAMLLGSSDIVGQFGVLTGPYTISVVWITGPALGADICPLIGGYTGTAYQPVNMLGIAEATGSRTLFNWRADGPPPSYIGYETFVPSTPSWATDTAYLITMRVQEDNSVDIFINGVQQTTGNSGLPSGYTVLPLEGVLLGGGWPRTDEISNTYGFIGAAMRYGVALSNAEIANLNAVMDTRYNGAAPPAEPPATQTYTMFGTAAPDLPFAFAADNQPVTLGTKFRSSVAGQITHLRFYKSSASLTVTNLRLWDDLTDTQLASVNVPANAPVGWVEGQLATPFSIQADKLYVVSYFAPSVGYPVKPGHHANTLTSGVLTIPSDGGSEGPNGVARYNDTVHGFPFTGLEQRGYFADVKFVG